MPLDPPVMTATLPSSFPMTSPFVVSDRPFGDGVDAYMGPAASGVQCGSSHIGGAKANQASESLRDDMRWSALRVYGNERRQGRHAAPFVRGRDAVRYFLAVARGGSVRAAAERLGVNHTTVLRRLAQLEERLGARMFEKLPSGYRLTKAGEEVLQFAEQMEASSNRLETRVFGRDQGVRGLLRVTLASPLATHLLMPDFA